MSNGQKIVSNIYNDNNKVILLIYILDTFLPIAYVIFILMQHLVSVVSSSHRPCDITIQLHVDILSYGKYRCQNLFLQPQKLLTILQNNDAIKYISHYKKYGLNDYGQTGLWTNWFMAELSRKHYFLLPKFLLIV